MLIPTPAKILSAFALILTWFHAICAKR